MVAAPNRDDQWDVYLAAAKTIVPKGFGFAAWGCAKRRGQQKNRRAKPKAQDALRAQFGIQRAEQYAQAQGNAHERGPT